MNIQTERLDNHTARLTVEVDTKQWEDAKKESARQLSQRYKIPGFRKGKAPYRIIEKYIGEAPILEDAIERLGNEVYQQALTESAVQPYAAGSLEDFQPEPQPTYIFTVPLQPEVELSAYRETRLDYEEPSVSDDDVDEELRRLQEREALVEDSHQPVAAGNRVKIDLDGVFADGEEPTDAAEADEEAEATDEEASDEDEPTNEADLAPKKGEQFAQATEVDLLLDPENEPVLPGFIDALVGAETGDDVQFELTVPEDEEYDDIKGRKVKFNVTIHEVQTVTLPALNDDFANRLADEFADAPDTAAESDDNEEAAPTLTLLELRIKLREGLQERAEARAKDEYANGVLDAIIEQSTVVFPDVMVSDRVHDMLHDLDNNLRQQQGIDLETYQKVTGLSHEDLHEQYEPEAENSLTRSLVLGEIMVAEGLRVTNEDVEAEIERTLAQFGEQADIFRQYFDTPQQRDNIANSLLYQQLMERLQQIGKGEAPVLDGEAAEDATVDASDSTDETAASDEVVAEAPVADAGSDSSESDEDAGETDMTDNQDKTDS